MAAAPDAQAQLELHELAAAGRYRARRLLTGASHVGEASAPLAPKAGPGFLATLRPGL